jgi:flagellar L-ring protein precursor FlgH
MMLLMSACSMTKQQVVETSSQESYQPEPMVESAQVKTLDNFPSLISDHKPYKVGQSLTVMIFEEATSATSAGTQTNKSTAVSARLADSANSHQGSLSLGNNAEGSGEINREGRLVASVSATVQQVFTTGEMLIFGEQKIAFNNETQYIRVSGRVRPEDISSDNVVLSSRISQAEITYKGDGLLGSRQQPGVITEMFNWLF